MTSITTFLTIGLVLLILTSIVLFLALQKARQETARLEKHIQSRGDTASSQVVRFINPLIKDRDPLGNILRYMYNYQQGKATAEQGFEACQLLLHTLDHDCGLRFSHSYRSAVEFDSEVHSASVTEKIAKGQQVIVIEPGWSLNGTPLTAPIVQNRDLVKS